MVLFIGLGMNGVQMSLCGFTFYSFFSILSKVIKFGGGEKETINMSIWYCKNDIGFRKTLSYASVESR